jgi:hypothetical protein
MGTSETALAGTEQQARPGDKSGGSREDGDAEEPGASDAPDSPEEDQ